MPAIAGQRSAEHQAPLLLLGGRRDLDREMMDRRSLSGWSAALGEVRFVRRAPCGAFRRARFGRGPGGCRRSARCNAPAASPKSPGSRSSTAVRPLPLGAIRASSCWPGCSSGRCEIRTVSMCTNTSSPPNFVGPLDETIAANAVEPFDLHRLERAGRFRKRLAVRAFAHRTWTSAPAAARPRTCRSTAPSWPAARGRAGPARIRSSRLRARFGGRARAAR